MLTREQAIQSVERRKREDRVTLERAGLPAMVNRVSENVYFADPANEKYDKSERVLVDGFYSELHGFTFHKAYQRGYWCIEGKMPMDVAEKLYADPVGKTDIRVAGHCCCPPPSEAPWFSWITKEGKTVISTKDWAECVSFADRFPDIMKSLEKNVASDEPEKIASPFVISYHIDSELGLRIFVDAVKALGAAKS